MKVVIIKGIVYVDSWSFDDFISNDHKGKNVKYNGKRWLYDGVYKYMPTISYWMVLE